MGLPVHFRMNETKLENKKPEKLPVMCGTQPQKKNYTLKVQITCY